MTGTPLARVPRPPNEAYGVEDAIMIFTVAALVLGAAFVGLCLVLRDEQRARHRR